MVERGDELDRALAQHAVAEHVARHVADAGHGERRLADIDVELAEMTLHRFPGAARGDAHFLVVVAGGATGGEGIAQPEIVRIGDVVGDVGERRRPFVGGDHQIRIVAVMADDVGRRHDAHRPRADIVGDVEQRRDEELVGLGSFRLNGVAGPANGQTLGDEAALGADRHDHGILHVLRLHQAEDFGAEILRPVGPADAAARHLAEAQMHGFEPRRVDEDLVERPRRRDVVELAACELDRDKLFGPAVTIASDRNRCAPPPAPH